MKFVENNRLSLPFFNRFICFDSENASRGSAEYDGSVKWDLKIKFWYFGAVRRAHPKGPNHQFSIKTQISRF